MARERLGKALLALPRRDAMTLHNHFHSFLDQVHREGRYRVFTDLERHAEHPPHATWRSGGASRDVVVWCSKTISGWDVIPLSSMPWSKRRGGWAPGPEVPATSPVIAMPSSRSRRNSRICTAR